MSNRNTPPSDFEADGSTPFPKSNPSPSFTKPDRSSSFPKPDSSLSFPKSDLSPSFTKPDRSLSFPKSDPSPSLPQRNPSDRPPSLTKPDQSRPPPSFTKPDPSSSFPQPNSSLSFATPDPSPSFTKPDASLSLAKPDPSPLLTKPDASLSLAKPDPSPSLTKPDASLSFAKPDPSSSLTKPDPAQPPPSFSQSNPFALFRKVTDTIKSLFLPVPSPPPLPPPLPPPYASPSRPRFQPDNLQVPIPLSSSIPVDDISILFPFEHPYPAQLVVMSASITALRSPSHGLLESPTGTGKTVALLASMLGYMESEPTIGRLYYTSRTHAQLAQVVSEFKKLAYFPKMSICAARKHLCIYPPVATSADCNSQCKEVVRHGGCPFDHAPNELPYFSPEGVKPKFDLEDLIQYGREHQICPYYAAKHMAASADLVICPYNYLISPVHTFITSPATVVVFDEGHNIDNFCRSECSLEMSYIHIHAAGDDAAKAPSGSDYSHIFQFVRKLTFGWLRFINRQKEAFNRSNQDIKYLSDTSFEDLIRDWGYSPDDLRICANCLSGWVAKIDADPKAYHDYVTVPLLAFGEKVGPILQLIDRENTKDFKVAYLPGDVPEFDRIAILCLRPGLLFHKVADTARSVIISSGTLSPFNSLAAELETHFDVVRSAPHVVDDSQVLTMSINRSGSLPLTSQYRQMNEKGEETLAAVGHVITHLLTFVPGGALLFLPSYSAKRQFLEVIKRNGTRAQIGSLKEIVEEESSKSGRDILADMDRSPRGGLLVGVCRGKMSEGMDFPDDRARIVFIFGIPYASFKEAEVDLKMQYNDEMFKTKNDYLTGRSWYETQAFRALSQALGRCVRHANDYGAIVLMDWRIDQHLDQFPVWVRRNVHRDINVDAAGNLLGAFYMTMHQRFPNFRPPPHQSAGAYTVKPLMVSSQKPVVPPPASLAFPTARKMKERVVPIHRELPRPLTNPATLLYCINCEEPVIGLENLSVANFATVSRRGYLTLSKNANKSSVTVVTIAGDTPVNLYTKVSDEKFFRDDGCSYEEFICVCGSVVGLRVSTAGNGSLFPAGTVTLLVRCMGVEINGRILSLDQLSKLMT